MGIDLRLLPTTGPGEFDHSQSLLELNRRRALWERIDALDPRPMPPPRDGVDFHGWSGDIPNAEAETGFGLTPEDAYDSPLTWLPAGPLGACIAAYSREERQGWPEWASCVNEAVAAYLGALHPDTPVVLFWH